MRFSGIRKVGEMLHLWIYSVASPDPGFMMSKNEYEMTAVEALKKFSPRPQHAPSDEPGPG